MPKRPKPEPVVVNTVCSLCGEPWGQHREEDGEVSTLECIRLLKAKLVFRPWWTPGYSDKTICITNTPMQWTHPRYIAPATAPSPNAPINVMLTSAVMDVDGDAKITAS